MAIMGVSMGYCALSIKNPHLTPYTSKIRGLIVLVGIGVCGHGYSMPCAVSVGV